MAYQVPFLFLGLAALTAGAQFLVRGGASLARHLGLTPIVIGLTVVAFGTSAPELVVSVGAALKGHGDIAAGNVVGSNILNIGVILAIAALISPLRIHLGVIKLDVPFMIVVSVPAARLIGTGAVPRAAGALLFLLLIAYTVASVLLARRQASAEVVHEFDDGVPPAMRSFARDTMFVAAGLGLLVVGAHFFVESATAIARWFGVSEAVIGLTIVAAGTSMPELATTVVAAVRGQVDLAVGNIVGSNIFNVLGILGMAAMVRPLAIQGIGALDLWVMLAYAVALLPLLWTRRTLQRWEAGLLLAGYAAYVWALWPTN